MSSISVLKLSFILLLLRLVGEVSYSQEINQYDNRGLKQGPWLYFRVDTSGPTYEYYIGGFRSVHNGKPDSLEKKDVKLPNSYRIKTQVLAKGNYLNNEPDGHWTYYTATSEMDWDKTRKEKLVFKGDSADLKYVYSKEILKNEIDYKNGIIHGIFKMYYPDGTLKSEINFVANEPLGPIKTYHDSGKLMFEGELLPGEQFYQLTEYYYTGSKRGARKLSVSYMMENFANLDEVEQINYGF